MKLIDFIVNTHITPESQYIAKSIKIDAELWLEDNNPINITPALVYDNAVDIFRYEKMSRLLNMIDTTDISEISTIDLTSYDEFEIERLVNAYYYTNGITAEMTSSEIWERFISQYAQEVYSEIENLAL